MVSPMRLAFALADPVRSSIDFSGATELQLDTVEYGDTVSFYRAVVAPGVRFVGVDWSDGNDHGITYDNPRVEILYPDENGVVELSHTYAKYTRKPVVKITDGLSELRFSGVTLRSVGRYSVEVVPFTGASKLESVDRIGSKVNKTLAPGLFANTGIKYMPAGYSLPSVSSRKSAPCIPLACFVNCSSLASTVNMPSGAVAIDALAFSGCSSLASLSGLSSSPGIVHIGYAAFRGCTSLASLSGLSCTLAYDSYNTLFGQWTNMDAVLEEMHPGATKGYRVDQFMFALGYDAFNGCTSLADISSLNVSSGWLLRGTFSGCSKLANIPSGILARSVGDDYTGWTEGSSYYLYPGGYRYHGISRHVKADDVYQDWLGNAGRGAYERWDSGGVFDGTAVASLPYSRRIVLAGEFANCTKLTSVVFSSAVERVAGNAFSGCAALMSVTFQGKTMAQVRSLAYPSTGTTYYNRAFPFGLPSGCVITCSDGTITV